MYLCYDLDMSHRTTILLDEDSRKAARELALQYDCSTSEAIRRAILRHHESVFGVPARTRRDRVKVLQRLFELFEGHDAEAELRELKQQDSGF